MTAAGLVSAREVAALFRVTPRTLWNWERNGTLVPVRINTRRYYRAADLDALCGGSAEPLRVSGLSPPHEDGAQ